MLVEPVGVKQSYGADVTICKYEWSELAGAASPKLRYRWISRTKRRATWRSPASRVRRSSFVVHSVRSFVPRQDREPVAPESVRTG